jgi:hypothetical protein
MPPQKPMLQLRCNILQELAGTLHAGTLAALQRRPDGFIDYLQLEAGFRLVRGHHVAGFCHSACLSAASSHLVTLQCISVALGKCASQRGCGGRCVTLLHACWKSAACILCVLQVRELHTPREGSRGFDRPMYLLEKLAVE